MGRARHLCIHKTVTEVFGVPVGMVSGSGGMFVPKGGEGDMPEGDDVLVRNQFFIE